MEKVGYSSTGLLPDTSSCDKVLLDTYTQNQVFLIASFQSYIVSLHHG